MRLLEPLMYILAALWLLKVVWHRPRKQDVEIQKRINIATGIAHVAFQRALEASRAVEMMRKQINNGELDRAIANDAVNRETRAKAALVAILKQDGCSQDQIDDVLQSVDDQKPGDLDSGGRVS